MITGAGETSLLGNNTFTGAVSVLQGSLQVGHNNALGAVSGSTAVRSGAAIIFNAAGLVVAENIALAPGAQISSVTGANQITGTLTLLGPGLSVASCTSTLDLAGVVSGAGSLGKIGAADLTFSGLAANTFTGGFVLNEGVARLQKTAGVVALPGPVWIGDGIGPDELRLINANQIADAATLIIASGGTFNCNNLSETIAALQMTEGTVSTGTGTLTLDGTLTTFAAANTATINGNLAVKAPASTSRIWTIADGTATDDLTVNAVVSSSPSTVSLELSGSGRPRFTAANTISNVIISNGTAIFTGTNASTRITLNGGTLGGTGTVSDIASNSVGGTVSPGTGAGILSAATKVVWNSQVVFTVELSSAATYDRLNAAGPITLGNATLNLSLGFTPAVGQTFLILRNTGSGSIAGQFTGLPEGAFLAISPAHIFQITYAGGDGNDIVLTRVAGIAPQFSSLTIIPGTGQNLGLEVVTFKGVGMPGLDYQLETSEDLVNWLTESTQSASLTTGALQFVFTQTPGIPQMFFRLRLP